MSITVLGLSADRPLSPHGAPPPMSHDFPHAVLSTPRPAPDRPSPSPRRARPLVRLRLPRLRRRLDAGPSAGPPGSTSSRSAAGPEPRPDWVVTSQGAIDTELGILKTGKEADVFLVERADPADPDGGVVMAAKRYRSSEHRTFHRAAAYTEGRSTKRSRDERALKRKSTLGARSSRPASGRSRSGTRSSASTTLGLPVPYPVQIDGTEILMEWITVDGETAPRLAQTRPEPDLLASYFEQLRDAMALMVQHGVVARRPLGVQHPRRGRAAGDHRPAADRGPRRQPGRHGLPAARLHQRVRAGSAARGSTSTSTSCSASCWRTRSEPARAG